MRERDYDILETGKKTFDRIERKTMRWWNSNRLERLKEWERSLRWCEWGQIC
jgi:hypothetical protein